MGSRIIAPGADFSSLGLGWFGQPLPTDQLQNLYYFGSGFPNAPSWDYSLNGRDAVAFGSPSLSANYSVGGGWRLPNGADILGSSATLFGVYKKAGGLDATPGFALIGNYDGVTATSLQLSGNAGAPGAYTYYSHETTDAVQIVMDSYTGTGYEMLFGVTSPAGVTIHRRAPGISEDVTSAGTTAFTPSSTLLVAAQSYAVWTAPTSDQLVSVGTLSKAASLSEINAIYAAQQAFLAEYGITI